MLGDSAPEVPFTFSVIFAMTIVKRRLAQYGYSGFLRVVTHFSEQYPHLLVGIAGISIVKYSDHPSF